MSYDPTNHDEFSELLSAYLDGELTADEQALVEQRLAESAEFRQLHDDLRALRGSLEMLPRYKLTEDLAPIVLRRAERAMLSAPAAAQLAEPSRDDRVSLAEQATPQDRFSRTWRAVRWSVVAIAVALLIMVFNPGQDRDAQNIALKRDAQSELARPAMPLEESPPGLDFAADRELGEKAKDRSIDPSSAVPAATPPAMAGRAADKNVIESLRRDRSGKSFADSKQIPALKDADVGIAGGKGAAALESRSEGGEQMKALANELGDAAPPEAAAAGVAVQQLGGQAAQFRYNKARREDSQVASTGGVVVVQCEISAEALRTRAFEQLLTEQQIALVDHANGVAAPALEVTAEADVAAPQKPADSIAENAPAGPAENGVERTLDRKAESAQAIAADEVSKRESEGLAPPIDAYYVEASPAQIEATLAALGAQTEQFPSFTVDEPVADELREEESAKLGKDDRLSKTAEAVDKVELPKAGEPIAKESKRVTGVVADQEGNTETFELNLQPAGGGGGAGGFVAPAQRGLMLRGGIDAKPRASAQRVLVSPDQFGATSLQDESVEQLKADANLGELKFKQQDKAEKKFAERRKAPERARAFSQPTPTDESPADSPAAPAATAAPLAESAPIVDGDEAKSGKVAGRPNAAADHQAPSVRVLFLFRAVPSAASER